MTTPKNITRQIQHLLTTRPGLNMSILLISIPAFNYIHEILSDTETMSGYCVGDLTRDGKGVKTGKWLIICTNQQLVFMHKGMIVALTHFEIPLGNLAAAKVKFGFLSNNIKIHDGNSTWELYNVNKTDLTIFELALNNELATFKK